MIFSGIIPWGLKRIINRSPIPTNKNLKYGALSIKCTLKAFVSGRCAVKRFIKNKAIGAACTHRNHTTKPPRIAPKLFPVPPTITITQITNVYLIGL